MSGETLFNAVAVLHLPVERTLEELRWSDAAYLGVVIAAAAPGLQSTVLQPSLTANAMTRTCY